LCEEESTSSIPKVKWHFSCISEDHELKARRYVITQHSSSMFLARVLRTSKFVANSELKWYTIAYDTTDVLKQNGVIQERILF